MPKIEQITVGEVIILSYDTYWKYKQQIPYYEDMIRRGLGLPAEKLNNGKSTFSSEAYLDMLKKAVWIFEDTYPKLVVYTKVYGAGEDPVSMTFLNNGSTILSGYSIHDKEKPKKNISQFWYEFDRFTLALFVWFTFDKEKLQSIHNQMNSWKYPICFWYIMPSYFSELKGYFREKHDGDKELKLLNNGMCKYDFMQLALSVIKKRLTERELLNWHWLNNLDRTQQQFDDWYKKNYKK